MKLLRRILSIRYTLFTINYFKKQILIYWKSDMIKANYKKGGFIMTNEGYQLIAIIIYMAAMIFIGWYAFKRTSNLTDYMLRWTFAWSGCNRSQCWCGGYVGLVAYGISGCNLS